MKSHILGMWLNAREIY